MTSKRRVDDAVAAAPARYRPRRRSSVTRIARIRPATISSWPSADQLLHAARATSGAMRWRWTSHHGRAWRRKRRCSASPNACQSALVCGRRLSTAARQPTCAAALAQPAPQRQHIALRHLVRVDRRGVMVGDVAARHLPAPRQCDDPAADGPLRRATAPASTMVRPVPRSSTSPLARRQPIDRRFGFRRSTDC